jgi:hypothetical protein
VGSRQPIASVVLDPAHHLPERNRVHATWSSP